MPMLLEKIDAMLKEKWIFKIIQCYLPEIGTYESFEIINNVLYFKHSDGNLIHVLNDTRFETLRKILVFINNLENGEEGGTYDVKGKYQPGDDTTIIPFGNPRNNSGQLFGGLHYNYIYQKYMFYKMKQFEDKMKKLEGKL